MTRPIMRRAWHMRLALAALVLTSMAAALVAWADQPDANPPMPGAAE
jgi:hypothetical protein